MVSPDQLRTLALQLPSGSRALRLCLRPRWLCAAVGACALCALPEFVYSWVPTVPRTLKEERSVLCKYRRTGACALGSHCRKAL